MKLSPEVNVPHTVEWVEVEVALDESRVRDGAVVRASNEVVANVSLMVVENDETPSIDEIHIVRIRAVITDGDRLVIPDIPTTGMLLRLNDLLEENDEWQTIIAIAVADKRQAAEAA